MFATILTIGIIYEWLEGSLNWKIKKMTSRIIIISMVLAWTLLSINNSINLRLTIIAIAILFTILIGINVSSWYAIILFLIYIGGIIVIFSYFVV